MECLALPIAPGHLQTSCAHQTGALQALLHDREIAHEDSCNFLWDVLKHTNKLPDVDQLGVWRQLGKVLLTIDTEIREESGVTLRKLSKKIQFIKTRVLLPLR